MTGFWTPEPIWEGETAYLLAGGPSLRDVDLSLLRGRKVLTINSSHARAIEAGLDDGILFFTDIEWFTGRRDIVAAWRGPVITSSRPAKAAMPQKIKRVQGELRDSFPPIGAPVIRKGHSSGQTAIGLAASLGAIRIVLLAYDMREVDGRTHHHDEYRCPDLSYYSKRFIPGFAGWKQSADEAGIEILNATPDSALVEFPMINFETALIS